MVDSGVNLADILLTIVCIILYVVRGACTGGDERVDRRI